MANGTPHARAVRVVMSLDKLRARDKPQLPFVPRNSLPELHAAVIPKMIYATPRFKAINRPRTTPIVSSPVGLSSVGRRPIGIEPHRAACYAASTRTLPVRALKIIPSVEKYTPATDDSEPEQPDSDYEVESSESRDTTTETEAQAAEEQEKTDKGKSRQERRLTSAGRASNGHQHSFKAYAHQGRETTGKTPAKNLRRKTNAVQRLHMPVRSIDGIAARRAGPRRSWRTLRKAANIDVQALPMTASHLFLGLPIGVSEQQYQPALATHNSVRFRSQARI